MHISTVGTDAADLAVRRLKFWAVNAPTPGLNRSHHMGLYRGRNNPPADELPSSAELDILLQQMEDRYAEELAAPAAAGSEDPIPADNVQ